MLSFFSGVGVLATSIGLLLSQKKYVIDILSKHNMLASKHVSTLFVVDTSLTTLDGSASVNATMYHQVLGGLQHLRMTCPDISFVVNKLSHFMHVPSDHHWGAVKRLFHYLNGTRSLGIRLLVNTPLRLHGFSYTDYIGNPNDRTTTGAFLIFLGANPIFWSSTKQRTVAHSSTEAKYHVIAVFVVKLKWVKSLLLDLLALVQLPPTLFSDNFGVTYLSVNLVFNSRIKHLVIDYHCVRDLVQSSMLCVVHVSIGNQLVDAVTKSLSRSRIFSLCNKIGVIFGTPF